MENTALFMRPMLATCREAGEEVRDLVSSSRDDYLLLYVPRLRGGRSPGACLELSKADQLGAWEGLEAEDQAREDIGT